MSKIKTDKIVAEQVAMAGLRAAGGAAYYDEADPDWASKIDPDELDMSNCDRCVMGQLSGGYWKQYHILFPAPAKPARATYGPGHDHVVYEEWAAACTRNANKAHAWMTEHGFAAPDWVTLFGNNYFIGSATHADHKYYAALRRAWLAEIRKRREMP